MIEGKDYFICKKEDSKLMKFISKLLFFNKTFMTDYVTTIGRTIYVPSGYISSTTLRHELVHVADYNAHPVWFTLSYLLVLPIGWTMRAYWEKRGYEVTIREDFAAFPSFVESKRYKDWITSIFTGPDYFYMCFSKKHIEKWFDSVVEKCKKGI